MGNICEVHRKEYFFKSITDHATDTLYMEESDKLERELGGGKNLEEWKSEKAELDSEFKKRKITEETYSKKCEEIEQKIKEAEEVRRFKLIIDKMVLSGEGKISNRLKKIHSDKDKIEKIEQQINGRMEFQQAKDATAQFARDINIFSSGQIERFTYAAYKKYVNNILQKVCENDNLSVSGIRNETIFKNMSIEDYDRLSRVLREYESDGIDLLKGAIKLVKNPEFAPSEDVVTSYDIACLTEAIKHHKQKDTDLLSQIINGTGALYDNFIKELNECYNEIKQLTPHKPWTSKISMLYHHPKHAGEFGNPPVSAQDYFGKFSEQIFKEENLTSERYSQDGSAILRTYISTSGIDYHYGFTMKENQLKEKQDDIFRIATHYK
ncbi:hypothetical protein FO519_009066, partial [Halicephalobus sp. NKZ332]